jgi:2-desacetyl-2-hydroxyethyl bacteriochlorophyllide A dehydrogenase
MKAVIYEGTRKVRVETVPMPKLLADTDAIVRVTAASICGTDIRLYWGTMTNVMPMVNGEPLGHECVGVVEEVGKAVTSLKVGQRVVSPFSIHCGTCFYCEHDLLTRCESMQIFGIGKGFGAPLGGCQSEYVRVPSAERVLLKLDDRVSDAHATVLPDVLTGVFAGMECVKGGETVAVLGCGPTGLAAVMCARLLGAGPIFAIDHHDDRLAIAAGLGAIPINFDQANPLEVVRAHTGGRGADVVADAVGKIGSVNAALPLVRPYGTFVLLGYIDPSENLPIGTASLNHVQIRSALVPAIRRYQPRVMQLIANGRLDPTPLLSHTLPLAEAARAYEMMSERRDGAIKIVLKP